MSELPACLMRPEELARLHDLASGRSVLELGTWHGSTTFAMSDVATVVWTVDHHFGDSCTGPANTLGPYIGNLEVSNNRRHIVSVIGQFRQVLPLLRPRMWDFVLVDGDHDQLSVEFDCISALALICDDGVVAVHDFDREAVEEVARRLYGPPNEVTGTLAVWRFATVL